ncbi:TetR/AcrR family transcriptional regulator, transcriptional repressor for nem operon [Pedobacter steynii]|uniref:TetR/AcrR family transcriptional regulator, transcriptional repressor for nem operon n=1 Tax=Pedobacter steynii TaxID=430522 RepID=A0A1G9RF56_9SPHI|nr:TetR/AcrR family transcriptional regulator [Pedobacter steynii]NQX37776.1 TetR/AcrR family transcriptional regulator [Pedobacter steynii]SDM21801.1 TetR/AcrR family transcriptional regulator, transcriptional repressor for nem operon [Pedobacter steynii]
MARNKEFDPTEKLEKARDLFWEKGYHATSMQDLVSQMKVNRGSMYDTYGDKHQLFIESLQNYARETYSEYKKAAIGEKSPFKSIELIIKKAIERSFEEEKVCMIVKSSFEMAPLDNDVKEILKQLSNALISIFEDLIGKAQQAGEMSIDKNARQSAQFIVGSFAGLWQMQALYNDRTMVEQMAKSTLDSLK